MPGDDGKAEKRFLTVFKKHPAGFSYKNNKEVA